jgi:hypothetical protein
MKLKSYLIVVGTLFLIIGSVHALRVEQRWPVLVAGQGIPLWVSWVALALAAFMAWQAFRLTRGRAMLFCLCAAVRY